MDDNQDAGQLKSEVLSMPLLEHTMCSFWSYFLALKLPFFLDTLDLVSSKAALNTGLCVSISSS